MVVELPEDELDDIFICNDCHKMFRNDRTFEEMQAEALGLFGYCNPENMDMLCDNCFKLRYLRGNDGN